MIDKKFYTHNKLQQEMLDKKMSVCWIFKNRSLGIFSSKLLKYQKRLMGNSHADLENPMKVWKAQIKSRKSHGKSRTNQEISM